MRSTALLLLDLLIVLAKSLRPRGYRAIIAENLILRHQLTVLSRSRRKAPNLRARERIALGCLSPFISPRRLRSVAIVIKPATLLKFHRALVKRKYRRLFSNSGRKRPGPTGPSQELIAAIVALKQRNPQFGCPRIAYIITVKFGIEINKDVVRRVLARHFYPDPGHAHGPSWLTLLGHSKDSLWSIDLFRCESLTLKSHWVLVVMDQWSRRIVGFGASSSIAFRSGIHWISSESWMNSRTTTTNIELTQPYPGYRLLNTSEFENVQVLIFDTTAGSHNAAACFKSLFQHDYEFATHTLDSWPFVLLLMFPEAFINGMVVTAFTVFYPDVVKTFDDDYYLND